MCLCVCLSVLIAYGLRGIVMVVMYGLSFISCVCERASFEYIWNGLVRIRCRKKRSVILF